MILTALAQLRAARQKVTKPAMQKVSAYYAKY